MFQIWQWLSFLPYEVHLCLAFPSVKWLRISGSPSLTLKFNLGQTHFYPGIVPTHFCLSVSAHAFFIFWNLSPLLSALYNFPSLNSQVSLTSLDTLHDLLQKLEISSSEWPIIFLQFKCWWSVHLFHIFYSFFPQLKYKVWFGVRIFYIFNIIMYAIYMMRVCSVASVMSDSLLSYGL